MIARQFVVLAACSYSAFGYALHARALAESWSTLVNNVPATCVSLCAGLGELGQFDPANPATAAPFCTVALEEQFGACTDCYETNAPQIFTPTILADSQNVVNQFVSACIAQGSPIPSIVVPTPTASGSASPSASSTPTPSASASPSGSASTSASSTSSRSGALGRKSDLINVGTAGFLAAIGMVFFA